eukprot:g987.t1
MGWAVYHKHCCADSDEEICMKSSVRSAFEEQIKACGDGDIPGGIFDPLVQFCKETIRRDLLPRFRESAIFKRYKALLASRESLKAAEIPLPLRTSPPDLLKVLDTRAVTLEEIMQYRDLYLMFRAFLKKRFCDENLYCLRGIEALDELIRAGDVPAGEELAWVVYNKREEVGILRLM